MSEISACKSQTTGPLLYATILARAVVETFTKLQYVSVNYIFPIVISRQGLLIERLKLPLLIRIQKGGQTLSTFIRHNQQYNRFVGSVTLIYKPTLHTHTPRCIRTYFTSCVAQSTVSRVAPASASATKTTLSPALGKGTVMQC